MKVSISYISTKSGAEHAYGGGTYDVEDKAFDIDGLLSEIDRLVFDESVSSIDLIKR